MENFYFSLLIICFPLIHISKAIVKDRILSECYPNWNECIELSTDPYNMQCLSCKEGFNLYSKSHNCLKCPHYINYEQIECIDSIPDGYYLEIESLGILDKCHELCKKCDGAPTMFGMQCTECKYKDEDFEPNYPTDCPDNIDDDPYQPVIGKCPREEPILIRDEFWISNNFSFP